MLKIQTVNQANFRITDSIQLDSGVKIPVIMGQCSQVDLVSGNGYRYKNGFWDKILDHEQVQTAIKNRDMLGMVEHPEDDNDFMKTPYEGASHMILDAWNERGNPFAKIGLLNNSRGNDIKALVDLGHKPGVSTRGLGSFGEDSTSKFVDQDNYMFLTWDIVRSPNFADMRMDKVTDSLMKSPIFKEMKEMYHLRDSVDEAYSSANLTKDIATAFEALTRIQNHLKNN